MTYCPSIYHSKQQPPYLLDSSAQDLWWCSHSTYRDTKVCDIQLGNHFFVNIGTAVIIRHRPSRTGIMKNLAVCFHLSLSSLSFSCVHNKNGRWKEYKRL